MKEHNVIGNITDFDSVIVGSSPAAPAKDFTVLLIPFFSLAARELTLPLPAALQETEIPIVDKIAIL